MAEIEHGKYFVASQRSHRWQTFLLLWGLSAFGLLAIIPYSLSINSGNQALQNLPLPMPELIAIQIGGQVILFGALIALGLSLARRIDLGAPLIEGWLDGQPVGKRIKAMLLPAVVLGGVASSAVILLEAAFFQPRVQALLGSAGKSLPANAHPPLWQGFLASFYGAFDEELLMRLFLMTVLAWIGSRIWHTPEGRPSSAVMWSANLLAAILFGLGHLPATQALGLPLNALVISRAIVLNGLGGVLFGWFYWRKGLGSAMLAHFSVDIVLHVIAPLFLSGLI